MRDEPREDHYVHLYGVTWADYLRRVRPSEIIGPCCAASRRVVRGAQGAARVSVRGWPDASTVSSLIGLRHTVCR
jgi:hypothetical protein